MPSGPAYKTTIYFNPPDGPLEYVARTEPPGGGGMITIARSERLERVRRQLRGLGCVGPFPRTDEDDSTVVERWT